MVLSHPNVIYVLHPGNVRSKDNASVHAEQLETPSLLTEEEIHILLVGIGLWFILFTV